MPYYDLPKTHQYYEPPAVHRPYQPQQEGFLAGFRIRVPQSDERLEEREPLPLEPTPLPSNLPDHAYDGMIIGPFGIYSLTADLRAVLPFSAQEPEDQGVFFYVPGSGTSVAATIKDTEKLADIVGSGRVLAIYNSIVLYDRTQNELDLEGCLTAVKQWWGERSSRVVNTLCQLLLRSHEEKEKITIFGKSHAGILIAGGLRAFQDNLRSRGFSQSQIKDFLRNNVRIVTLGAAETAYPDGAVYFHIIGERDLVTELGVAESTLPVDQMVCLGLPSKHLPSFQRFLYFLTNSGVTKRSPGEGAIGIKFSQAGSSFDLGNQHSNDSYFEALRKWWRKIKDQDSLCRSSPENQSESSSEGKFFWGLSFCAGAIWLRNRLLARLLDDDSPSSTSCRP